MSLPVKRIYINSNFKTLDSKSDSDFKFQLSRTFSFPKNSGFYIEDFTCSHAWYSVEAGLNDSICMRVNTSNFRIELEPGNYTGETFAVAIQNACNIMQPNIFTVDYNMKQHNITIKVAGSTTFKVYTDDEALLIFGTDKTINNIIKNIRGTSATYSSSQSYTSGFIELLSIRNIYLHSPNLSSFSTYGGKGESNIIKKIPITSDFGYLIVDSYTSDSDWLDCSNLSICNLEFQLRDSFGNLVPLHGSTVSFAIVFSKIALEDN